MAIQEKQSQANLVLNLLTKEQRQTENSIKNIMEAIENGGTSNTVMKRLRELESRQDELSKQILVERSKTAVKISEDDIRKYYVQALRQEPKMLINYLIKQIVLFDDKIQIQFNSPIRISPNDDSGFSFYSETLKLAYKVPFRRNLIRYEFLIQLLVK